MAVGPRDAHGMAATHALYSRLAPWWPLLSPPEDYAEAEYLAGPLGADGRTRDVLMLGSGGGHLASHLSRWFAMTLCDVSPPMVEQARAPLPDAEHHVADMRSVRLRAPRARPVT